MAAVPGVGAGAAGVGLVPDELGEEVKNAFVEFLEDFSSASEGVDSSSIAAAPAKDYVLQADEIRRDPDRSTLYVDFTHVMSHNQQLADSIIAQYFRLENFLCRAVFLFMRSLHPDRVVTEKGERAFYVAFFNLPNVEGIRDLKTSRIGQLMAISGTVTRSTEVRPELLLGSFKCVECGALVPNIEQQFKYTEPPRCVNAGCNNREAWSLDPNSSTFVDWQRVRLQESASEIPAGSMPRSMDVILRNEMVEKAKPGDKVVLYGAPIVIPDLNQLTRNATEAVRGEGRRGQSDIGGVSGLKALGVRDLTYRLGFLACGVMSSYTAYGGRVELSREDTEGESAEEFTAEERERVWEIKESPELYKRMVRSVAPTVFGHEEIKRGILLMLFGGVHKRTKDAANLRGDINVCIVGDPSTSKSQFLKYVVSFLPRAVYTSGKASSAAGLTASVVKDSETGEFTIEAGALMLADNSVCCIDEFDKMDATDQTAIHEAMEQQTISIAKAGIQATLNARTSVLAAANPIRGRYDKSKSLKQNVTISAPIMSRFDLFYVVLDECDELVDYSIARHIVNIHQNRAESAALSPEFSTRDLQLYIRFARTVRPHLTPEAQRVLLKRYLELRQADATGSAQSAYRITVRQLESMIRLSEALARLHLDPKVRPEYAEEAARLLRMSIIHVDAPEISLDSEPRDPESGSGSGGSGGPDGDDRPDGSDKKHVRPTKPTGAAPSAATPAPANGSNGSAPPPAAAAAAADGASSRLKISGAEYARIRYMLTAHVRRSETPENAGMRLGTLVDWYLSELERRGALPDLASLQQEHRKVVCVVRRLLLKEHVFIEQLTREDTGEVNEIDRVLEVHPNYNPEDPDAAAEGGQRPLAIGTVEQQRLAEQARKLKEPVYQRGSGESAPAIEDAEMAPEPEPESKEAKQQQQRSAESRSPVARGSLRKRASAAPAAGSEPDPDLEAVKAAAKGKVVESEESTQEVDTEQTVEAASPGPAKKQKRK